MAWLLEIRILRLRFAVSSSEVEETRRRRSKGYGLVTFRLGWERV